MSSIAHLNISNIKTYIIENGITPHFENLFKNLEDFKNNKKETIGIYASTPFRGLEALYKATNEKGKSITFQSLSNDMKDSLYNDSILKRMNTLEADYEAKSKQSEIELLKSESALNNLQRQEEKRIRNFLLTFSALLLTLFAIVVYFFIKNKDF
jgi:hypothetical protein